MKTSGAFGPEAKDRPSGRMCGSKGDVPVLYLDGEYGSLNLWFRKEALADADRYLTELIAEANKLRDLVRKAGIPA